MYKLIIIGSGPAGYVAAIRAGQMGLKTLVIEKDQIGGMCLNWGCIPSKALLESAKFYHRIQKQAAEFGIEGLVPENLDFNWEKAVKRADKITRRLKKGIEMLFKKNSVEIINGEASILDEHTVEAGGE
jgi:dihydrolipoamide dehydrogenase